MAVCVYSPNDSFKEGTSSFCIAAGSQFNGTSEQVPTEKAAVILITLNSFCGTERGQWKPNYIHNHQLQSICYWLRMFKFEVPHLLDS